MLKGIIFDLDGVILFTDEYHYLAWKRVADEEGIYFDRAINHRLRGVSRMESLEIILERAERAYDYAEKKAIAERKNGYYRTLLAELTPAAVSQSVVQTLAALRARGLKLAIGSSSKNAGFILERVGLTSAFDAVSDGNSILNSKPDPEVFLHAASLLELAPADCLVVEDAFAGIKAAVRGGFRAAATGEAVSDSRADFVLREFSDLLTIAMGE